MRKEAAEDDSVTNRETSRQEIDDRQGLLPETTAQLEQAEAALVQVAERESRRIAQELHTNLCQHLVGTAFLSKALADQCPADPVLAGRLGELARLIGTAVEQTRSFNYGADLAMGSVSFVSALRALAGAASERIKVIIDCPDSVVMRDSQTALNLYRIAQEAVANAALHSRGSQVVVRLHNGADAISLRIEDDGSGSVETLQAKAGMGVKLMRLRARAISATLRFETSVAGGICVDCCAPQRP